MKTVPDKRILQLMQILLKKFVLTLKIKQQNKK